MPITFPAQIRRECVVDGAGDWAVVGGDVVFEAVVADVVEERLEGGHFGDAEPAERRDDGFARRCADGEARVKKLQAAAWTVFALDLGVLALMVRELWAARFGDTGRVLRL